MPRHKTTAALRHVDEYERAGMFPAAFDGMSALRSSGLITAEHRGWGHYRVTITDSGRKTLEAASGPIQYDLRTVMKEVRHAD